MRYAKLIDRLVTGGGPAQLSKGVSRITRCIEKSLEKGQGGVIINQMDANNIEIIEYDDKYEQWYVFLENNGFAGFDSPWDNPRPTEKYSDDILKAFLAKMENMFVGLISLTEWLSFRPENDREEGSIELNSIGVLPEFRGRGAGSELIEAACQWASQKGYRKIYVFTIGDARWEMHRFYRKNGFKISEQWIELIDNNGKEITYKIEDYWANPELLKHKINDRYYVYSIKL